jgi:Protein of unknown function (DUF3830)
MPHNWSHAALTAQEQPLALEILIAYGSCSFASKVGQLAGNHFLTVVEGQENLRPLGVEVLWGGATDILFEQA